MTVCRILFSFNFQENYFRKHHLGDYFNLFQYHYLFNALFTRIVPFSSLICMQIQFFLLLILLKAPLCGVSYVICYGSSDCNTIQVVKVDLNFTVQPHARCHSAFPAVPVFHCIVNKSVLNEPTKKPAEISKYCFSHALLPLIKNANLHIL